MAKKKANTKAQAAAGKEHKFRSRIIGYGEVDPKELLANPRNWRIHPDTQQEALEAVLTEVGWVDDVIVNKGTGFVLDGHLRVALALRNEEPSIPVKYIDLSLSEERIVLATLDPLAAMASTDVEQLDNLLLEIEDQDAEFYESEPFSPMLDQLLSEVVSQRFTPPTLEELEKEFGKAGDKEAMVTVLKIKVTYKTIELYYHLLELLEEPDHTKAVHMIFETAEKALTS